MPVGTCDTCGEYNEQLKYKNEGWHCPKCIGEVEIGKPNILFIPGKGCASYGYRKREQGKVVKRIMDRGREVIANGG